jgi:hypothetical protein
MGKMITEDYIFPKTQTGKGSKVEVLPTGKSIDMLSDIEYFQHKLLRSFGIPASGKGKFYTTAELLAQLNYDRAMKVVKPNDGTQV